MKRRTHRASRVLQSQLETQLGHPFVVYHKKLVYELGFTLYAIRLQTRFNLRRSALLIRYHQPMDEETREIARRQYGETCVIGHYLWQLYLGDSTPP